VILAVQSGIPIARVELLDEVKVRACNVHSKLSTPEVPTLFVEFHTVLVSAPVHDRA
jgi:D-lactate dehydrogenase (cytochrome)